MVRNNNSHRTTFPNVCSPPTYQCTDIARRKEGSHELPSSQNCLEFKKNKELFYFIFLLLHFNFLDQDLLFYRSKPVFVKEWEESWVLMAQEQKKVVQHQSMFQMFLGVFSLKMWNDFVETRLETEIIVFADFVRNLQVRTSPTGRGSEIRVWVLLFLKIFQK